MSTLHQYDGSEIAIIGMAGRFPGARNLDEFWRNLRDGVEGIRFPDRAELAALGVDNEVLNAPNHVRAVAMMDDIELFDAAFFGYQPREAELMDPQHRIFLECAWEALESAGYDSLNYPGAIGVYAGTQLSTYLLFHLTALQNDRRRHSLNDVQISMHNSTDFLSTRVSYKLNLTGPSHTIQSACSTSLVAVHVACQNLLIGECDMALAGGISINVQNRFGYLYLEDGIASPDGHCRAFDAQAQGTLFGSGVGIVVLKRLEDALADGDTIHAIIRGSAINNDGARKAGYTAPSVEGQARVISEALANAGFSAETISYIEAHGTGTALGDPIEIEALSKAYSAQTDKIGFCAIGSVKSNIGHLDTAAGISGLIKTVLALKHKQIPPTLHFTAPNPQIDFANSPFYVNAQLREWKTAGFPRRAGVSSFGIGGTNAHVILEEAPAPRPTSPSRPWQLLLLSARSATALEVATQQLADWLKGNPTLNIADVAYTTQVGRRVFDHRRIVICSDAADAARSIETRDAQRVASRVQVSTERSIAFMFPGAGAEYVRMALGIYHSEPIFCEQLDYCALRLKTHLGYDLRDWLYPPDEHIAEASQRLHQPALALPALFSVEYALARLWMAWGVQPQALIGHSMGEYVAACLAGVFTLDDALSLVALRGRLFEQLPTGAMLSVALSESELHAMLPTGIDIAAVNGPASCVVSGPVEQIRALADRFTDRGLQFRHVPIAVAAHSALVEPILEPFTAFLAKLKLNPPEVPFLSNVTGTWISAEEATDPHYWARHLRQTVRFTEGVQLLLQEPQRILLEVGPGTTLSHLARRQAPNAAERIVLPSLRHRQDERPDMACILDTLGKLWLAGAKIDWDGFYAHEQRNRVPLPTYPFERKRYWIEPPSLAPHSSATAQPLPPVAESKGDLEPMPTPHDIAPSADLPAAVPAPSQRRTQILAKITAVISDLTGQPATALDSDADFFQLGLDSLLLVQANHAIKDSFGIEVTLRQLHEELTTLNLLATYIDTQLPPEPVPVAVAAPPASVAPPTPDAPPAPRLPQTWPAPPAPALPPLNGAAASGLEGIFAQQLALLSQQLEVQRAILGQQLELLRGHQTVPNDAAAPPVPLPAAPPITNGAVHAPASHSATVANGSSVVTATPHPAPAPSAATSTAVANGSSVATAAPHPAPAPSVAASTAVTVAPQPFVAYRPLQTQAEQLTPRQRQHLEDLMTRLTARTQQSKQRIQDSRQVRANHRNILAFRMLWKEMVYPIIAPGSRGSRVWDLDGNEYIDLTMGFGVTLFGHSAPFIMQALEQQLQQGILIGPYGEQADQVAQLIAELTGVERVAFYNSGTEAVMVALRLARAITGRPKIALFAGAYHGTADSVLVRANLAARDGSAVPLAPGVPASTVSDVLVLNYDSPQALEIIRAHRHELAAVLVEPVQSRRPDLQPRAFLHELRKLTSEIGAALIFDEIITGFRVHPGGAQAYFGVQADLVTYGKVVAGGLPIGIVAGKAAFMDGIDGGMWRYGDDSFPPHDQHRTIVGGTFCEHPLAMATALAVLRYLKEQGPALQQGLNERTAYLAETLNTYFEQTQTPIRVAHFSSILRFVSYGDAELLFYHLLDRGIYTWEGRSCFLSLAHSDEDIAYIIQAVKDSVDAMRTGGFLPDPNRPANNDDDDPPPPSSSPPGKQMRSPPVVEAANSDAMPQTAILPLSEEQRQLWFLAQISEEAAAAYNDSSVLQMHGPLDTAALRRAIQHWVNRHEALRTRFHPEGNVQEVLPTLTINVPLLDWSDSDPAERSARRTRWLANEVRTPFRLDQPPLLRNYLIKWSETEHDLIIIANHLAVDGWSWVVLLHDMVALYPAERDGQPLQLPVPNQFRQYLWWQDAQMHSTEAVAARNYWREHLAAPPPALLLPSSRPRPAQKSYAGSRQQLLLEPDLYQAIKQMGRQHSCTVFMIMLAAFQVLLHRLSGQSDFVIALPTASQPLIPAMDLVGQCTNTVPFRSRFAGDPSFSAHLAAVKQNLRELLKVQQVSFARLSMPTQAETIPAPELTVMFNMDRSFTLPEIPGLDLTLTPGPIEFAKFDLFLNIMETSGTLRLDFDYNRELFSAATCQRWLQSLEMLLRSVVTDTTQPVSALPLLTQEEQQLRQRYSSPASSAAAQQLLLTQLIAAQIAARGTATAIVCADRALSYAELDQCANQLAHYLHTYGIEPGTAVGICLEPGWKLAVALLGTLKAGAALALYDPENSSKLDSLSATRAIRVWLSETALATATANASASPIICLDTAWPSIAQQPSSAPSLTFEMQHPAWLIDAAAADQPTDGICLTQATFSTHMTALRHALALSAGDSLALWLPRSIHQIAERFFATLLAGTRLLVCMDTPIADIAAGKLPLPLHEATVVDLPLHHWRALTSAMGSTTTPRAWQRVIINGAPPLHADLQRGQTSEGAALERLWAYQPTLLPLTVAIGHASTEHAMATPGQRLALGTPLASFPIYLCDSHGQPTLSAVSGDLYLVASPWLPTGATVPNSPRWLRHPAASDSSTWLYHSGDRAHALPDGSIDMPSPASQEMRLRGYSLSLNDIAAIICQHPALRDALVLAADTTSEPGLTAYVVAQPASPALADELRRLLQQHLAAYQLPIAFVFLAELPRQTSGTIASSQLPQPRPLPAPVQEEYVAPRTPLEATLAELWAAVFGCERISITASFFDLGGQSLLATQLLSRIRQSLNYELPLRILFEAPTIAALAQVITGRQNEAGNPAATAVITQQPRESNTFALSFAQQRLWYIDQLGADATYNLFSAVRIAGPLDLGIIERAFNMIVQRHETLRTTFVEVAGEPFQVIGPTEPLTITLIDLQDLPAAEQTTRVQQLVTAEAQQPFDLARGPLLRVKLLRLSANEHQLLVTMHHIISDGWSIGVMLRELTLLYQALQTGQPTALPELPIQYVDFTQWQRQWLQGPHYAEQLAYWRQQLGGELPLLELPTDYPRPLVESFRGATHYFTVPPELLPPLRQLSQQEQATLFMTLLAAFQALLYLYSGQTDILVGTPVANRHHIETEGLIGFFVNMLVIRSNMAGHPSFRNLIGQVRDNVLAAYAHQDLPFDKLVEVLMAGKERNRTPLFQVMFLLDTQVKPTYEVGDLHVSMLPVDNGTAKFDISLMMEDTGTELRGSIEYRSDLFEAMTIARMADHYVTFLRNVVADPTAQL